MRQLLPCLLSCILAACGASLATPASSTAPDDAAMVPDVPDVPAAPACPPLEGPPTRELALDGEEVVDNLTNAPIAVIGDCNRAEPVQHHVFTLRVPRATSVALSVASEDPSAQGIGLSLRTDCASPETACVGANTELRRALDAGAYRVVVSTRINRWIPYRLRAVTAPAGG